MPRIEHVAMWVHALDEVCDFYARHFGAAVGERYENAAKGFASRFLTFASGARMEVMSTTRLSPAGLEAGAQRMGLVHLAIALGSEAAVDTLTARLRALGVPVLDGPRRTGDGYYQSVVLDPEGNRIELLA
jgi:lactoylglutathione lyase